MFPRQFAGLSLALLLARGAAAQQPQVSPTSQEQEPRYRIQIDVAATVPDNEHWIELQSKNFLLAGTASEDDIRKVAADLELLRDTFIQFFPRAQVESPTPTTVLVFRNSTSFRWYRPEDDTQLAKAAYVQVSPDKTYIVMTQGGSIPREVYRDYLRLLIPQATGPVPLWFREGIADYFSSIKVERFLFGDKRWIRVGTGIDEYDRVLDKKAKLFSFDALFKIREDSPEYTNPETRKVFLAQSWGVVHYLMSRPGSAGAMQRFFNLLGDSDSFENSASKALLRSAKLFEDDFKRYIRTSQSEHQWAGSVQLMTKSASQTDKGECGKIILIGVVAPRYRQCFWDLDPDPPGVFRIPFSFDKTWAEVSPLKSHDISESEAWFYRGDLMLHIDRLGESDAYLQRAIGQPAPSSRTYGSLGLLQMHQKRYTDAEKSLKLALEIDPQNYLARYYRTLLIRLKGLQTDTFLRFEDLEEIHSELLKIIAAAPHFAEAAEMLSVVNILRQTAALESEKVLLDSLTLYPGRSSLWVSLANVTARTGDTAGTRWLLTRLLAAGAPDPGTRQVATKILEGIAPGASRAIVTMPEAGGALRGGIQMATAAQPSNRIASKAAGEKLHGVLTNIECKNGLTFNVKSGGKNVKLHANSALSVEFIARNGEGKAIATNPVVCGPTTEEGVDVTITYRPNRSGESIGEPQTVEIRIED